MVSLLGERAIDLPPDLLFSTAAARAARSSACHTRRTAKAIASPTAIFTPLIEPPDFHVMLCIHEVVTCRRHVTAWPKNVGRYFVNCRFD